MDAEATPSGTPERDELLAFELGLDERVCDEVRPMPWGRLFLTPSLPLVWDANWIALEREGLALEEVVAIADEALGGAGYEHRTVGVLGEADGKRLAAELEADLGRWPGWAVERDRYMVWRGAEEAEFDAREVGGGEIEDLRREIAIEQTAPNLAHLAEATAVQLSELDRRYGLAAGDRWFAAPAEGEPLSCCRLLQGGRISQVEDVATLARGRERGLAKAVVRAAIAAARADAADTIFLIADAADWPQLLYGRLGFETVGELTVLRRRA
jgi:ribosomal protein S18 acetylase RimI-like enzyme